MFWIAFFEWSGCRRGAGNLRFSIDDCRLKRRGSAIYNLQYLRFVAIQTVPRSNIIAEADFLINSNRHFVHQGRM